MSVESIKWTGKNTREVRKWIAKHGHPDSHTIAMFISRRDHNVTTTLWLNVAHDDWGEDVTAAVWCRLDECYHPLRDGGWIICGPERDFAAMEEV